MQEGKNENINFHFILDQRFSEDSVARSIFNSDSIGFAFMGDKSEFNLKIVPCKNDTLFLTGSGLKEGKIIYYKKENIGEQIEFIIKNHTRIFLPSDTSFSFVKIIRINNDFNIVYQNHFPGSE